MSPPEENHPVGWFSSFASADGNACFIEAGSYPALMLCLRRPHFFQQRKKWARPRDGDSTSLPKNAVHKTFTLLVKESQKLLLTKVRSVLYYGQGQRKAKSKSILRKGGRQAWVSPISLPDSSSRSWTRPAARWSSSAAIWRSGSTVCPARSTTSCPPASPLSTATSWSRGGAAAATSASRGCRWTGRRC